MVKYFLMLVLSGSSLMAQPLPIFAKNGMVSSQETLATQVGVEILQQGGNAVDAAVAVGFTLAVTLPKAGNLGGGGFMLIKLTGKDPIALDFRETAPAAITVTSFLDDKGEPDPKKSRDTGLSVGVPGTVAGMAYALEKYGSGKFTLAQLIQPSYRYARQGITVIHDLADSLPQAAPRLSKFPSTAAIFLDAKGKPLEHGAWLVQTDLAKTLETISRYGVKGFYEGEIATKIAASVKANGGVMTTQDLASYKVIERNPVTGNYKGYDIISMPPPSSGGTHLIQMLNMIEKDELKTPDAASIHWLTESMKRAYADRFQWLGDPDSVKVPVKGLTSKLYAANLRSLINDKVTPAQEVKPGNPLPFESDQTTHYSIVDKAGNAVSTTYTLNFSYGMGLVAEGTGILLNNELDDFAAKAGAVNGFGLVQGESNLPGAGKRPLSSMSPTIVLKDGKPFLVTGTPGGSRIITMTLNQIINIVDFKMNLQESVNFPRFHHQWQPDAIDMETGFSSDTIELLKARGHKIMMRPSFGSVNAVMVTPEGFLGASDPRQRGTLAQGY